MICKCNSCVYTEDSRNSGGLLKVAANIYYKEGLLAFWTGFGAYLGHNYDSLHMIYLYM